MTEKQQNHCPPPHWAILSREEKMIYLKEFGGAKDFHFVLRKYNRIFKCHKWVLSMLSPVFKEYFRKNDKTTYDDLDVEPDTLLYFLDFVYFNDASKLNNCSIEVLAGIMHLSKRYKVAKLQEAIIAVANTAFIHFFNAVSDISNQNVKIFPVIGSDNSEVINRILTNSSGVKEKKKRGRK